MTYEQALAVAILKSGKKKEELNTPRQRRKFRIGFGRVRMYAGMTHTRVAK